MHRYQVYRRLYENRTRITSDAARAAADMGFPAELRGRVGLIGALSSCPGALPKWMIREVSEGLARSTPLAGLVEQIRELVKDVYGDDYDAAPVNTCEAGLWVALDVLASPPALGRGGSYRARYIAPYEKQMHHQGGYGRPFPPKYKDLFSDRGATGGELGFYAKRLSDLDVVVVKLAGASYEPHGVNYHVVPVLLDVDPEASIALISRVAERHGKHLTAIVSMGYDTPGYGYGAKDENGVPRLQKHLGQLARSYDVPYIVDNAFGLPFLGTNPAKIGADVIVYSMDKAAHCPTSGLIIGREDVMVPIRRALGFHGGREGSPASYGQSGYVAADPGKAALLGQVAALRALRDKPRVWVENADRLESIVREEFDRLPAGVRDLVSITKTYNSEAVEVNWEGTWRDGRVGIPLFSSEDAYCGSSPVTWALEAMGVMAHDDCNMYIAPGFGTSDENGVMIPENMRWCVRALVETLRILANFAGA